MKLRCISFLDAPLHIKSGVWSSTAAFWFLGLTCARLCPLMSGGLSRWLGWTRFPGDGSIQSPPWFPGSYGRNAMIGFSTKCQSRLLRFFTRLLRLQLIGVLLEESLCMISWIDQESRTDDNHFIIFFFCFF
jgi:hypothetical protein